MIVKIFTGPLNYDVKSLYEKEKNEYIIGVDQACSTLMENNIEIDLAVGDFDSIKDGTVNELSKYAEKTLIFPVQKDYTDTYLAVREALKIEHSEIIIYGGLGKRIDHTLANVNLLKLGNITIENEHTIMYMLHPGKYEIESKLDFISFYAKEDVVNLVLKGFKYPLHGYNLEVDDPLCVSNQGSGIVSFDEGVLLVIEQNDF